MKLSWGIPYVSVMVAVTGLDDLKEVDLKQQVDDIGRYLYVEGYRPTSGSEVRISWHRSS